MKEALIASVKFSRFMQKTDLNEDWKKVFGDPHTILMMAAVLKSATYLPPEMLLASFKIAEQKKKRIRRRREEARRCLNEGERMHPPILRHARRRVRRSRAL